MSKKKEPVAEEVYEDIVSLCDIPFKNFDTFKFERGGRKLNLNLQSVGAAEVQMLRELFPIPQAPIRKRHKETQDGKPMFNPRGEPVMEEYRDGNDFGYLTKLGDYSTSLSAGKLALSAKISFHKEGEDKSKEIPLMEKIDRIKNWFSEDAIAAVSFKVDELSTIKQIDLDQAVKN